jgi:phage terminase small subunit
MTPYTGAMKATIPPTKSVKKSKPKPKRSAKPCGKTTKTCKKSVSDLSKPASNQSKLVPNLSLTAKQQLFVTEYLVDLNATQAAIRAGYSVRTARLVGPQNMSKYAIKAAIDAAIEERKKRIGITADEVIRELVLIGMADMKDFVRIDEGGFIQALPLDTLAEGKSRIIKKVKEKRVIKSTAEGDQVLDSTYEFELCDKVKSLEMLGRHLGILNEKHDVDVKQHITIEIVKFAE